MLIDAVSAPEVPPSTTRSEAGGAKFTVIGFTVNLMLEVWLALRFGLMVEPMVMVAVHVDARDAEGGV